MSLMKKMSVPIALVSLVALTGSAYGFQPPTPYTWDASTPNYNAAATVHTGTINTGSLIMADYVGRDSGQLWADSFGSSGAAVGWDDAWVGGVGNANTNGDALDGLWVQIYSTGGWWDLGQQSRYVAGFTSQDHGPYVGEGTEYRVFGSNTLWGGTSPLATLTDLYLDGWRTHNSAEDVNGNGWLSDDIAAVFDLGASYRYVKIVAWGGGSYTEPEMDAIARVVPEPTSMSLLMMMLVGGAAIRYRKRR